MMECVGGRRGEERDLTFHHVCIFSKALLS